jgi:hypothetical protein
MRDISLDVIESIMDADTIVDEVVFKTPLVDCMKRLRLTEGAQRRRTISCADD